MIHWFPKEAEPAGDLNRVAPSSRVGMGAAGFGEEQVEVAEGSMSAAVHPAVVTVRTRD